MKCLRCGRCCFYMVVVIAPEAVKPDLDVYHLKEEDVICLDGSETCPHLSFVNDEAVCAIHDYDWFKDTPCGSFTQEVESNSDSVCRIGQFMRKNPDVWKKLIERLT